ncbi:MAG: T9SS type A sorting domain-containing protein [Flavobacterium sp.]
MKEKLLLLLILTSSINAQQKSTGEVSIINDVTASIVLDNATETAVITLSGPDDRWFALKYGSFTNGMQAGPDVLYYNGSTLIDASQTGSGPVQDAVQDITIVSNTLTNGVRTFVVSRLFVTGDSNDFNFNFNDSNIDLSGAHGQVAGSYTLSFHGPNRAIQTDRAFQTLGVDDFSTAKKVVIYPNPAKDILSFDVNVAIDKVGIYSHSGSFIREMKLNSMDIGTFTIDISDLSSGIYLLEFKGNQTFWEKIIIQ